MNRIMWWVWYILSLAWVEGFRTLGEEPRAEPESRETVYGDTAYHARVEMIQIQIRCTKILTEMSRAWRDPARERELSRQFDAELAKLDGLELRVFGPRRVL